MRLEVEKLQEHLEQNCEAIWVLQTLSVPDSDSVLNLIPALDQQGIAWISIPVMPFALQDWGIIDTISAMDVPYFLYGSTRLIKQATIRYGADVSDQSRMSPTQWQNYAGSRMVNTDPIHMRVGDVRDNVSRLKDYFSEGFFIRPNGDFKPFQAQAFTRSAVASITVDQIFGNFDPSDQEPCLIYPLVFIEKEVRVHIVNKEVVAVAPYKGPPHWKKQEVNPLLRKIALSLAQWVPQSNVVMDIAFVDGQWKILEFNTINCSGFYNQQDIPMIVKAIQRGIHGC